MGSQVELYFFDEQILQLLIHWHVGASETCALNPPYSLILAGDSLHWMEWRTHKHPKLE
jgi:hypothetical protein